MFSSNLQWEKRPKRKHLDDSSIKVTIPKNASLWNGTDQQENAPILSRTIASDFEMKVKVSKFKNMKSLDDQAGLMVRVKKNIYMRLGIEMCTANGLIQPCIGAVVVRDGLISDLSYCIPLTKIEQSNDEYWFMIKCKKGLLTSCYSIDGKTYTSIQKVRLNKMEENELSVGLYGSSSKWSNGFKVIYQDFYIYELLSRIRKLSMKRHSSMDMSMNSLGSKQNISNRGSSNQSRRFSLHNHIYANYSSKRNLTSHSVNKTQFANEMAHFCGKDMASFYQKVLSKQQSLFDEI